MAATMPSPVRAAPRSRMDANNRIALMPVPIACIVPYVIPIPRQATRTPNSTSSDPSVIGEGQKFLSGMALQNTQLQKQQWQ